MSDNFESDTPWIRDELANEIARARNPAQRALLVAYANRLNAGSPGTPLPGENLPTSVGDTTPDAAPIRTPSSSAPGMSYASFVEKYGDSTGTTGAVSQYDPFVRYGLLGQQDQAPQAQAPAPQSGNFVRGAKVALGQTMPLIKGALGLVGATAEQAIGPNAVTTGLKNWGLHGYQEGMQALEPLQKDTDELTTAWAKAQNGDWKALLDWATYGVGYSAGQLAQAAGTAAVGGVAGTLMAGPAGGVAGAAEGTMSGGAIRAMAQRALAPLIAKEVEKIAATDAGKALAADELKRLATANIAKRIGQDVGLGAYAGVQEAGQIYPDAEQQAQENGKPLDGAAIARIWAGTAIATASEGLSERLKIDALTGRVRIPGVTGRVARAATGAAIGAVGEGATEALQTVAERYGAGQSMTDDAAVKDIINSAGLGAIGGAPIGGVAGAFHAAHAPIQRTPGEATRDADEQATQAAQKLAAVPAGPDPIGQMISAASTLATRPSDDVTMTQGKLRAQAAIDRVTEDPEYKAAEEARLQKLQEGIDTHAAVLATQNATTPPVDVQGRTVTQGDTTAVNTQIQNDLGAASLQGDNSTASPVGDIQPTPLMKGRYSGPLRVQADDQARQAAGMPTAAESRTSMPMRVPAKPTGQVAYNAVTGLVKPAGATVTESTPATTGVSAARSQPITASSPDKYRGSARFADLTPRTQADAQRVLAQMRAVSDDPNNIEVVPHPGASGKFAIKYTAGPFKATPTTGTKVEQSQPRLDEVQMYVDAKRRENTPAARAFVQAYDAGRITPADVWRTLAAEQRGQRSNEQIRGEAAGLAVPAPDLAPRGEAVARDAEVGRSFAEPPKIGDLGKIPAGKMTTEPKAEPTGTPAEPGAPTDKTAQGVTLNPEQQKSLDVNNKNAKLRAAVRKNDLGAVVSVLGESNSPTIRYVAEKAKALVGKTKLLPASKVQWQPHVRGFYRPGTDAMAIHPSAETREHTVAHEIVHALTAHAIMHPSAEQRPHVQALEKLRNAVKKALPTAKDYGIDPGRNFLHEFIAEGFTNPEFQRKLAAIPYQNKSAWTKFVDTIAQLLGFGKASNAFTELMSIGDKIISTGRKASALAMADHGTTLENLSVDDAATSVGPLLREWGKNAPTQYGRTDAKSVEDIADSKGAQAHEHTITQMDGSEHGTGIYSVALPKGKQVTLTRKGDEVWINAAGLNPGEGGSLAYDIAATYAHNNGLRFIGDPAGLSDAAMRRRLENMLSSAIKFGTTDHIEPHPKQLVGNPMTRIPALKWENGKTDANIYNMVRVAETINERHQPAGTGIHYDAGTDAFRDANGDAVGSVADAFTLLSDSDRAAAGAGAAGRTTLQRNAVYSALLRSEDARRQFLENLRGVAVDAGDGDAARARGPASEDAILYDAGTADVTPRAETPGDYTPAQKRAVANVFGVAKPKTQVKNVADAKKLALDTKAGLFNWAKTKLITGLVDQFHAIKAYSTKGYLLARMSAGSDGTFATTMLYGTPYLDADGVAKTRMDGGVVDMMAPLKGEGQRFMQWVAGLRAADLREVGKENLISIDDEAALKTLNQGDMPDGRKRSEVYDQAMKDMLRINSANLDIGVASGAISPKIADFLREHPYVPFFRELPDGTVTAPHYSGALTGQEVLQKIKGGTSVLRSDLTANWLTNMSHLLASSAKNRAALATIDEAAQVSGVIERSEPHGKGSLRVLRDGVPEWYHINEPDLLEAMASMHYAMPQFMKPLATFKRGLTYGVTTLPGFKIKNLIRDSLQSLALADLDPNFLKNVSQGMKTADFVGAFQNLAKTLAGNTPKTFAPKNQTFANMLASGGIVRFGSATEGDRAHHVNNLIRRATGKSVMLDAKGGKQLMRYMGDVLEAWHELGDTSEQANRIALYEQLTKKGYSHAEASFMARDLLDFSMQGKWPAVRFLIQTVPFLNARLQGLYKLGRAAKDDPKRFAALTGSVALASLALYAAYSDDDDWKKREDWDRDSYWWFKIGGTAFRIPKPFETGSIGTIAERTAELMFNNEYTGRHFLSTIGDQLMNNFSLNPVPQAVKPLAELWANKDFFTGRSIETQSMQGKQTADRYDANTSMAAMALSAAERALTPDSLGMSPAQVDYLLKGYFGGLASLLTGAIDLPLKGVDPTADKLKFATSSLASDLPTDQSRYVQALYNRAREVDQAWASYQAAIQTGDREKAIDLMAGNRELLMQHTVVAGAKRELATVNQSIQRVQSSSSMSDESKASLLTSLRARRNAIAQRVEQTLPAY